MPDIIVENHGTIALLRSLSEAGDDFLRNNCESEPWQWLGSGRSSRPAVAARGPPC